MNELLMTLGLTALTCAVTILTTELVKSWIARKKAKDSEVTTQAGKCESRFKGIQDSHDKLEDKLDKMMEYLEELKQNGPDEYRTVKKGVQAILRRDMLTEYKEALKKKYATLEEKQNFDNMYNAYHNLGENGVMDGVHDEYMALPTEKPSTRRS